MRVLFLALPLIAACESPSLPVDSNIKTLADLGQPVDMAEASDMARAPAPPDLALRTDLSETGAPDMASAAPPDLSTAAPDLSSAPPDLSTPPDLRPAHPPAGSVPAGASIESPGGACTANSDCQGWNASGPSTSVCLIGKGCVLFRSTGDTGCTSDGTPTGISGVSAGVYIDSIGTMCNYCGRRLPHTYLTMENQPLNLGLFSSQPGQMGYGCPHLTTAPNYH